MKRQTRTLLLVALVGLLAIGFLLLASKPDLSQDARVKQDRARDVARFTPENSIDVAMAMGLVTHEAPKVAHPALPTPPLLLYPPSAETLQRMCGV